MIKTQRSCLLIVVILLAVAVIAISACGKPPHPQIQDFTRNLGQEIKLHVCKEKFVPGNPCGDRNVQCEADTWRSANIYVYGVVDEKEIQSLVDFTTNFRGEKYKAIPIKMTFYAGIKKGKDFARLSSPVVYKITIKGEN